MKIEVISYIKNNAWCAEAYAADGEPLSDLNIIGRSFGMATRKAAEDAAMYDYRKILNHKLDDEDLLDVEVKVVDLHLVDKGKL